MQIQVDFLESHPEHAACIHAYRRVVYHGDSISSSDIHKYPQDVTVIPNKAVINGTGMFGATASLVYKSAAASDYPDWAERAPVGDRPLKFVLFARGHIAYINKLMSVYRVGVPGSWTVRVQRNRKSEKKVREGFVQLLVDFDKWTSLKYHIFVKCALKEYKRACRKKDIVSIFHKPYSIFKSIIGKTPRPVQ